MAASPKFKIYSPAREYVAACKIPEDAAALAGLYGDGASVRLGHEASRIVWREGAEAFPASDSYDAAARVILRRMVEIEGLRIRIPRGGREFTVWNRVGSWRTRLAFLEMYPPPEALRDACPDSRRTAEYMAEEAKAIRCAFAVYGIEQVSEGALYIEWRDHAGRTYSTTKTVDEWRGRLRYLTEIEEATDRAAPTDSGSVRCDYNRERRAILDAFQARGIEIEEAA